ncbi:hypothetical protein BpHYR1_021989 [Brachionus plicatilis]|uniref:C2H2-type domain-containing protein n=1 Tax=Brachionus plicatilis TaxID=10195 RepID=A0A3M7QTX9_BRAPC|nr:hypothetical protein BpHYR1_021989 [Brachionus plicatilis]
MSDKLKSFYQLKHVETKIVDSDNDVNDQKITETDGDNREEENREEGLVFSKMCTSKSNTRYYTSREDIIEKLDESLKNVKISDVKRQALTIEKKTYENKFSSSTEEIVKITLNNKKDPIKCDFCGNYFEKNGLKRHITVKHKNQ